MSADAKAWEAAGSWFLVSDDDPEPTPFADELGVEWWYLGTAANGPYLAGHVVPR